ncbi:MAG: helix-turn-helix transcriptional regulator [Defluviimonas sp.]|nr:helix-turn-helix transcriptional regulator [Paracoccaceae bacterium]MCC0064128.1 helix-turn-helix transcriptional regulator [Defluviimonas sp.]
MERPEALAAFSALAHEVRLDLIRRLVVAGPEGASAGALANGLGISASRLSFHLAVLSQAGLIGSRRVSRHVIYRADGARIAALLGYLMHDCCCGLPDLRAGIAAAD